MWLEASAWVGTVKRKDKKCTVKQWNFIYPIYNHNRRNISTIYVYSKTSIKRNILTIKEMYHEVDRTKELSALLYTKYLYTIIIRWRMVSNIQIKLHYFCLRAIFLFPGKFSFFVCEIWQCQSSRTRYNVHTSLKQFYDMRQ